ncbi:MAG: MBL fold metallo-hydrolase [bacterium]|jgi:metallo-beta-lactamase family protein
MFAKVTFLGAAENVTGSRYLLEINGSRLLIDCGLYQERALADRNWGPFPVAPSSIDAVLLTHAHIDHCGYLPRLVRDGFQGPIHATSQTAEIAKIVLMDSAKIQAEDVAFKKKRHEKEQRPNPRPLEPLFTVNDVEQCCSHFSPVGYRQTVTLADGVEAIYTDAGHILGSASIKIQANGRSIIFSGDIGRWNRPILEDPDFCPTADYVVMESTYGDRLHEKTELISERLCQILKDTAQRGGNLIIPTFAIERAQEVLYYFNALLKAKCIPNIIVFLDSPMAVTVTKVFEHSMDILDSDMNQLIRDRQSPFHFPGLEMVQTVDASKAINAIKGTVVVMAGAGMCTGGRIKHHLANNLSRPESTVLFVGYQANGTLGRLLLNGVSPVRLLGQSCTVKAKLEQISGFSAHADRGELLQWLSRFGNTPPRNVFITHGEPETAHRFAETVKKEKGFSSSVPKYGQVAELE